MRKSKRDKMKKKTKVGIFLVLLTISIGYALLTANLNITGTSRFARTTWNIHFENLVPTTNMTLGQGEGASITQNKTTEVTYTLNFTEPGQYYEFLVDAKNDGTIDGMVNTITSTKKLGNETATPITTNPSNLPAYLEYSATYSDGTDIAQYHLLASGETETYKIRVAFRTDIEAADLPGSAESIELTFGVEYIQKDSNAIVYHQKEYTTNLYDGNSTTINDRTNTSVVWIGQSIPSEVTAYETPALAMAALKNATGGTTDRPFFLKHNLTNNIVTESYVGFVISDEMVTTAQTEYITNCNNDQECINSYQGATSGTYYLKGTTTYELVNGNWQCNSQYEDGNGNCLDPDYNTKKIILQNAFGSSNCREYSTNYNCGVGNLYANVHKSGGVRANDESWRCRVGNQGHSSCLVQ